MMEQAAILEARRAKAERPAAAKPHYPPLRPRVLPATRVWPSWLTAGVQVGTFVGIIALWQLATGIGWMDPFFWSQPSAIFDTLLIFVAKGEAFLDTWFTLRSTLLGFVLGTGLGTMLGLSFWWSRNYAAVVQPYLVCFESIPKLALAPLIILIFGVGLTSKVAIGMALTVIVSTLTTYAGVKAIDPDHEKLMYALGARRRQVFAKLVVPATLPWCISVLRVNIGLALTGSIVGEFISSEHGLGRTILYAGQTYEISLVWVAVFVLSALSILMYVAVSRLESTLMKGVAR
jgi:NitT/TauT family transport system permease protein